MTLRFGFSAKQRLKSKGDFQRVYDRKRSAADEWLVVYVCESSLPQPRVGLSVSKKVGCAVVRNRFKRLYREAFRLKQHELPAVDLIMIPRLPRDKPLAEPTLEAIQASLVALVRSSAAKLNRLAETKP
jgi:ribonuclease P protein component